MLRVDGRYRLQYGNMADNPGAEKTSSPPHGIVRKRRALWWTGGAVVLIALAVVTWLERKRIPFSLLREWISHPPDWFASLSLGAGALLALAILLAILWKVPQWQVGRVRRLDAKERFDRVNEARKTLATILGGAAFLVGGFFTLQHLRVAQQNLEVSREGQITDRFSKAIEQLGSEKLQVRLGGIYALEGIANESKELHWPIMEVLCTYVRVNAPNKSQEEWDPLIQFVPPFKQPAADIQAILTVLGRRDRTYEREDRHLDLSGTDLRGVKLLHKENLSGADLDGADLSVADLTGQVNLSATQLNSADLRGVSLDKADLRGASLQRANLYAASLRNTNLREADLGVAIL